MLPSSRDLSLSLSLFCSGPPNSSTKKRKRDREREKRDLGRIEIQSLARHQANTTTFPPCACTFLCVFVLADVIIIALIYCITYCIPKHPLRSEVERKKKERERDCHFIHISLRQPSFLLLLIFYGGKTLDCPAVSLKIDCRNTNRNQGF